MRRFRRAGIDVACNAVLCSIPNVLLLVLLLREDGEVLLPGLVLPAMEPLDPDAAAILVCLLPDDGLQVLLPPSRPSNADTKG